MNKKTFAYRIDDGDWHHFETDWPEQDKYKAYIAQDAAKDYYVNHDGWEDKWPLTVEIAIRCHSFRFEVELYYDPSFCASQIDAPTGNKQ